MPRFYSPPDSRLFLSKWDPVDPQVMPLLTFLDYLATDRQATFELGAPSTLSGTVPSSTPEINTVNATDNYTAGGNFDETDYPYLTEGVRLLHWLRREDTGASDGPWVCRFAGPILETGDASDANVPLTRFTAYDPWAYMFARPCLRCVLDETNPSQCELLAGLAVVDPNPKGIVVFPAGTEIQYIVGELLRRTISANGPCMIDAGDGTSANGDGNDYGGSADWTGIIETCATLTVDWVIQDGASVGEAWQQLHETGLIKIILTPVYDVDRPGICADLNIIRTDFLWDGLYKTWQNADVGSGYFPALSWDRSGHDAIEIQRDVDGTQRANKLQFLGPNNFRAGVLTNTQSINRFGQMWTQQQFNRLTRKDMIDVSAEQELYRREQGRRTWQFSPTPEWTIRPFQDFDLGYWLSLYHSSRLRQEQTAYGFVTGFSFDLSDEGTETVTGLQLSVDDGQYPNAP